MINNPAVSLRSVSHRYGKTVTALDDVSLTIPRGVTVGLIGPDGVGKSTLLSLIAGVKIIQSGTVEVFGHDMADKAARQALSHRIAFMPQGLGRNLYPTLSVYENVDFHARLFGLNAAERKARISRLLEATGLAPFPDRAAGKLSGGMKQKLSLCCALVHSPDLLILDEPTTGVDPLSRRQFWALVDELQAESAGMTVIVATAYIEEAERFSHLLAMDDGKLLVNKPTREVMRDSGAATLEAAYVQMLPSEKQQGSGGLAMTPFVADPDAPPAIEAHGLTKRFGSFTAVDRVSFKIAQGEIFGFLGSNGCGKSTTMKMLTGLLEASDGSAELLGRPIEAGNIQTRMRVGYMSQAFSLYEELSVIDNLKLHARLYQMGAAGEQAVVDALVQFDLSDAATAKPASLPLGIRQRLQLAAACLHKPEVLILDEPTSGVDPAARDMFWRHLLKLSREDKITIFVSTHFMNEAERCDRISFMHKGRVLAVGTPAELTARQAAPNLEEAFVRYLLDDEAREGLSERPSETLVSKQANDVAVPPQQVTDDSERPSETGSVAQVSSRSVQADKDSDEQTGNRPSENVRSDSGLASLQAEEEQTVVSPETPISSTPAEPRSETGKMTEREQAADVSDRPSEIESVAQVAARSVQADQRSDVQIDSRPSENVRSDSSLASSQAEEKQTVIAPEASVSSTPDESYSETGKITEREQAADVSDRPSEIESVPQVSARGVQAGQVSGVQIDSRPSENTPPTDTLKYWLASVRTFALRETKELLRDKVRLFFALAGPVILMVALSWSVSFDVKDLTFTVLDRDQTTESRRLTEYFSGSRYFQQQPPLSSPSDIDTALQSAKTRLVIEIPEGFGRDMLAGRRPEAAFYVDGAMPFNASNIQGYIGGIFALYGQDLARETGLTLPPPAAKIEQRFMYNQDFESIFAIAPGVLMLVLMLIPAMMSVVGVVREREIGSISNFYTSPATVPQFLLGKQLPYIAVGMVNYVVLTAMMVFGFGVPVKGSLLVLTAGTLILLFVSTALGLLASTVVRSQVAAISLTAIVIMIPTFNYSGFLHPLSSMEGGAYWMGKLMPASWYLNISIGSFTKGLGGHDLSREMLVLLAFYVVYFTSACWILKKQEK
ncbi:ABC transporter ATP-binding protein/permease [Neisseria zoodegmatis]|uniref:ABC transporter ATP-binding protein n=1 Tax=Neisseria zoodegmatis TaxID=326523 RepID=A0AB38DR77_9NEIS|nr:ABC transporter ATP-binding protein/permease [Neisseria zoodegmatis]OSI10641.1 ABC transporter ATP-binding protein/permease [Neisseria zoodegmatis]SNU79606.1 ABC transporter ATP-binding protein [Neisseria zoodegmatis]